jgi:hypothetical protein
MSDSRVKQNPSNQKGEKQEEGGGEGGVGISSILSSLKRVTFLSRDALFFLLFGDRWDEIPAAF